MNDNLKQTAPTQELVQMDAAIPGLYVSAPQSLPFAPSLDIRAFLLQREQGNLLVYSVTEFESHTPAVQCVTRRPRWSMCAERTASIWSKASA